MIIRQDIYPQHWAVVGREMELAHLDLLLMAVAVVVVVVAVAADMH